MPALSLQDKVIAGSAGTLPRLSPLYQQRLSRISAVAIGAHRITGYTSLINSSLQIIYRSVYSKKKRQVKGSPLIFFDWKYTQLFRCSL
jgi:hypothetical protein